MSDPALPFMIGLPAVLLGVIAISRLILYRRQRRSILSQGQVPIPSAACDAALGRASRLLRGELARVFAATILLIVIAACAFKGLFGTALVVVIALAAYVAETVIAALTTMAGWRDRGGPLLWGTVLAALLAWGAASSIGYLGWAAWLLCAMSSGVIAIAAYQLCEWLWLRPWREVRAPLADRPLLERMQVLVRQCGVDDVQFAVVAGDTHTVNARAESDPRGRRVVLWPALLQRLGPKEVDAVITHELGHLVHRHLRTRFLNTTALFCVAVVLASMVAAGVWAPSGVQGSLHVATTAALLPLILSALRGWLLALYRRQEVEADNFVRASGGGGVLADALLKLSPSMAAGPGSDAWHHRAYDSHPSTESRLARLRATR